MPTPLDLLTPAECARLEPLRRVARRRLVPVCSAAQNEHLAWWLWMWPTRDPFLHYQPPDDAAVCDAVDLAVIYTTPPPPDTTPELWRGWMRAARARSVA